MSTDYRERAAECLRLASETTSPQHCASLLEMAQSWFRLLDQAEKNSRLDLTYETPPRQTTVQQQQQQQRAKVED